MKGILFILFCTFLLAVQANTKVDVRIDLITQEKSKIKVSINIPQLPGDQVSYLLPNTQFGKFSTGFNSNQITNFIATDINGNMLKTYFEDYEIVINNDPPLQNISYFLSANNSDIATYQAGSNIFNHNNNYLINFGSSLGFIHGLELADYTIEIHKPKSLEAYTSLKRKKVATDIDLLYASDYKQLYENPLLYAPADTVVYTKGGCKFKIAAFSQRGSIDAAEISTYVKPIIKGLDDFFGGFPVEEYNLIFYFENADKYGLNRDTRDLGYGALMHGSSAFFMLPEWRDKKRLRSVIQRLATHEMLHLLTPHSLHTDDFHERNIAIPHQSKHLWFYEGITEYFTLLFLTRYDLIKEKDLLNNIRNKIIKSKAFEELSLTEISENISKAKYNNQFENFYQKGCLTAMLLDIKILEYTKTQKDLLSVLQYLASTEQEINEDNFYDLIVAEVDPELEKFFKKYIEGNKELPLTETLDKITYKYAANHNNEVYTFGNLSFQRDPDYNYIGLYRVSYNTFEAKNADKIIAVNGEELNPNNYKALYDLIVFPDNDEAISITVLRKGKEKELKAKPITSFQKIKEYLEIDRNVTEKQLNLHTHWLDWKGRPR